MLRGTYLLSLAGFISLAACGKKKLRVQRVPAGAVVLALGDSLTQGVGAWPAESFPSLLAQATGWNVVNAGVSGDTSAQALARLPALLAEHHPSFVIVSIGGNDFLRRNSAQETQRHIEAIIRACLDAGAQVLLVAVPAVTLLATAGLLSDHAMYATIARTQEVPLLEGAWADVLADESLRSDQVHANAQGYAVFDQKLQARLRELGFWS
nr:GDSL-type esterase/lipase family protein [Lampropedia puyangensis]